MSCNWTQNREDIEWCREMSYAVWEEKWDRVKELAEQRPVLLFWEEMRWGRLPNSRWRSVFPEIWRRNEAVGRECVRIVLKNPELAKRAGICHMGGVWFQKDGEGYGVEGPLLSFLAGCGELELMKEALKTGVNADGWGSESWYEDEKGMYLLPFSGNSFLRGFSIPNRRRAGMQQGMTPFSPSKNERVTTPLLIAILREEKDMVKLLIDHGASFDPEAALCRWYVDQCSSWVIKGMLKEAYGGC